MLKGKEKRHLRALAHDMIPIFQVGKGGVSDNLIKQIIDALEARELLKVSVLQNCDADTDVVARLLADGARAELVQVIGRTIVLYREASDIKNRKVILPS